MVTMFMHVAMLNFYGVRSAYFYNFATKQKRLAGKRVVKVHCYFI